MPMATKQATQPVPTAAEAARVAEFRVALRRFQHHADVVARECGITPAWYLLLLQIKGAPDLTEQTTVTALADRLQLAQSSVTELVSRAEQAGLLERKPSSTDARRSEEHTSELQSHSDLVCRLLLETKKKDIYHIFNSKKNKKNKKK